MAEWNQAVPERPTMPIHDWARVEADIFHHFHQRWIGAICDALNAGVLPGEYYALAEQRSGDRIPDVLTLRGRGEDIGPTRSAGNGPLTAVRDRPKTRFVVETDADIYARKQNRVTIRHVPDDRIVSHIEIVSPGNKSGRLAFNDFTSKVPELLNAGVHVLLIDVIPRTKRDPKGIHAKIWELIADERIAVPIRAPLTLVTYEAGAPIRGYFEPVAVGQDLPDMPLFLEFGWHVPVPLDATYTETFASVPARWRRVIEA